ncbi:MAG: phage tail tape measure protein [Alphaproteobacteria bacterium]|nr:phage tail tape measure protein [Alphaproteobacteria bacterium]
MSENKHQLFVTIGATLSSGFSSVVSSSTSKLKEVGNVIKDMEKQSVLSVSAVDKLKIRYNSLLGSINEQQAILQKRAFYRSQIMEVAALGASLAVPIRSAMKFQDSLAGIKAVVSFPEADGLEKFGQTLLEISRKVPVAADDLASIAAVVGRFGVPISELSTFSEEIAKTSVAWRANSTETAERVGNLMKVFNLSTSQLVPYFDSINELGNKTGATADQILQAVTKASNGLINFKLSIPQAAALTSTIISFGEGAEAAGSAVGTMLQRLAIAPKLGTNAQKALRSLGLSSITLPKMMAEDPQKVLDKLFEGVAKLDSEKRSSALYAIFGRGASKSVGKLIDNLELYRKNLQLVADQQNFEGSRDSDYQIVFETAKSQLNLLGNTFSSFSKAIGFSLLPTLQSVVTAINEILTPIVAWMEKNKELTQTITTTVAGFISFRVATFVLGYAATFLFGGLNRLVIAFKGLRLAMTLVGTTFKAFLGWPAALATAAWLIWDNWKSVSDFLAEIWKPVAPYWDAFIAKIKKFAFVDDIIKAWERVQTFFKGFFDYLTPLWDKFSNIFSSDGGIVSKFKNAFGFGEGKKSPALNIPKVSNPQSEITRNQNNNFAITINVAKNDDSESIANKVMNRVSDFSKTFLYDEATEVI